ncbi:hypothetical protein PIB30_103166, partial [Stylosanthes scabra]|nr:hypothetical protein [Stylosanthes scabra]
MPSITLVTFQPVSPKPCTSSFLHVCPTPVSRLVCLPPNVSNLCFPFILPSFQPTTPLHSFTLSHTHVTFGVPSPKREQPLLPIHTPIIPTPCLCHFLIPHQRYLIPQHDLIPPTQAT